MRGIFCVGPEGCESMALSARSLPESLATKAAVCGIAFAWLFVYIRGLLRRNLWIRVHVAYRALAVQNVGELGSRKR